jgi:Tol biopolymer transport system component/DNA-binding winged helix-turn-helix (wHTH) protein
MNDEKVMSGSRFEPTVPMGYEFAGYRLEPSRRALTRSDGTALKVSGKSFDALVYLVQHAGEIVDRSDLLHAVWRRRVVEDNNVNQVMVVLRRALGAQHIVTVAGRGYQFVTPVRTVVLEQAGELAGSSSDESERQLHVLHEDGDDHDGWPTPIGPERHAATRRRFAWPWVVAVSAAIGVSAAFAPNPWRTEEPSTRLGTVPSVTLVTTYPGEETTPSLSPDGTRIAFSWEGESGNRDIYVTQIGTRARARLTSSTEGTDHYPAWSPDGDHIAFVRQHDASRFDVFVIPSIGGTERKLVSGEREWISVDGFPLLAWTPDCRQLWFTTRHGDATDGPSYGLHRLMLATGEVQSVALGGDERSYDTSPAISPDGTWVAFVRYRRGERLNQIMLQLLGPDFTPTGEPRVIAGLEPGLYHSLAWAPGGVALRFVNGGQILEWEMDGATRVLHTASPQVSMGAVAMGSYGATTRAAVVTRRVDTDIFALPLDPVTHAAAGLPEPRVRSTAIEQHPRISPDGKRLAFVSDRSGRRALWIADIDGANERQITNLEEPSRVFRAGRPTAPRSRFTPPQRTRTG